MSDKYYDKDGVPSREDKFYYKDGSVSDTYCRDKIQHREDGPAEIHKSGHKWWFINGKKHREDGPAVEWNNGFKAWWIDNVFYTKVDFDYIMNEVNSMDRAMQLTDSRWWVREIGKNRK